MNKYERAVDKLTQKEHLTDEDLCTLFHLYDIIDYIEWHKENGTYDISLLDTK